MHVRPVKFKRKRGFFTFAQNSQDVDYVKLAYVLALSIKATQKENAYLSIAITPDTRVPDKYADAFDEIITIPWIDDAKDSTWKLENEWKAYHITPYEETIKLDADMIFTSDYSHWWDILAANDVSPTMNVLTYRNELITNDIYRKTFTSNELPNIYSGFFYFKQSTAAQEFFHLVEMITFNWEMFTYEFLDNTRPSSFSTDVAYALAAKILDLNIKTTFPTFVHLKGALQNVESIVDDNWLPYLGYYFTNDLALKIGLYQQKYPVHYHVKDFVDTHIIETLENYVNKY